MTSPTPAKKLSHEARLGIMVVTVLVFAFGFLVYHKVDMRQRALTQASIAGPGPAAASAAGEATATDAGNEQSVVSDPLQNSVPVASESPFADAADDTLQFSGNLSEPTGFADVSPVETSRAAADGFSEPALSAGPLTNTDSSFAADTAMETTDTDEPLVAAAEPATGEPAREFPAPAAEPTETISNADSTAAQQPAVAESPEAVLPAIGSDAEFSAPVAAAADDSAAATFSAALELTAEPAVTESTAGDAAAPQFGAAESPEPAAPAANEEPVLLALAEPQDPPAFPGFTPDEPVQRAPAAEPIFGDSTDRVAEPAARGRAASGYSNSAGFNAVARPAARPSRQALRNAAGSGTDGRFDLAAFNYQNSPQANPSSDAADVPTVVVQEGENYTKLSKRVYGTTRYFSALAVFNQHRIPDPRRMRPGMIVLTPNRQLLEEKYPQLFIDSQPRIVEPPGFLLLEDGSPAYRVGDRETLSDVSKKHLGRASRWIELYEMNRSVVNDPNKLKPGTILALPDDATEVVIMP